MLSERVTSAECVEPGSNQDVRYFARLFFFSFAFAQGGQNEVVIKYLRTIYPNLKFSGHDLEEIRIMTLPWCNRYVVGRLGQGPSMHTPYQNNEFEKITEDTVFDTVDKEVSNLSDIFYKPAENKDSVIQELTRYMIKRDFHFVYKGRVRVAENGGNLAEFDKWRSFINYYGFLGNSTGVEEYDQMFKDITVEILKLWKDTSGNGSIKKELEQLVYLWRRRHPDQDFFAGTLNS